MRVMELGDMPLDLGLDEFRGHARINPARWRDNRIGWTAQALLCYLCWPNNEERRIGFSAAVGANFLENLNRERDEHLQTHPDLAPLIQQTYGRWFQENLRLRFEAHGGGYGAVSVRGIEAYSDDVQNAAEDWMLTGFVIGKVRHMAAQPEGLIRGGAGIAKAIDLAAATTRYNRDRLRKAWSRCRDFAHVCGAILLLDSNISDEMRVIEDLPGLSAVYHHLPFVLLLAREYQEFGLTYVSHGRREPILPPDTLWRLPEAVPHLPEKIIPGSMSEEELTFLRNRKATSRD